MGDRLYHVADERFPPGARVTVDDFEPGDYHVCRDWPEHVPPFLRDQVHIAGYTAAGVLSEAWIHPGRLHIAESATDAWDARIWHRWQARAAAIAAAIECVLLDHADQLSGENVDANLSELAYVYEQVTGWTAEAELASGNGKAH